MGGRGAQQHGLGGTLRPTGGAELQSVRGMRYELSPDSSGTYHASYIIVPTAFGAAHLGQVVCPSAPPGLGSEDPVVFTAVVGVQKSKLNVYAPMWYPSDGEPVDGESTSDARGTGNVPPTAWRRGGLASSLRAPVSPSVIGVRAGWRCRGWGFV
jgi:hypothetical protein